jgi:hypothetical protein
MRKNNFSFAVNARMAHKIANQLTVDLLKSSTRLVVSLFGFPDTLIIPALEPPLPVLSGFCHTTPSLFALDLSDSPAPLSDPKQIHKFGFLIGRRNDFGF